LSSLIVIPPHLSLAENIAGGLISATPALACDRKQGFSEMN